MLQRFGASPVASTTWPVCSPSAYSSNRSNIDSSKDPAPARSCLFSTSGTLLLSTANRRPMLPIPEHTEYLLLLAHLTGSILLTRASVPCVDYRYVVFLILMFSPNDNLPISLTHRILQNTICPFYIPCRYAITTCIFEKVIRQRCRRAQPQLSKVKPIIFSLRCPIALGPRPASRLRLSLNNS